MRVGVGLVKKGGRLSDHIFFMWVRGVGRQPFFNCVLVKGSCEQISSPRVCSVTCKIVRNQSVSFQTSFFHMLVAAQCEVILSSQVSTKGSLLVRILVIGTFHISLFPVLAFWFVQVVQVFYCGWFNQSNSSLAKLFGKDASNDTTATIYGRSN